MEINIVATTLLRVRELLAHDEVSGAIRLIESLLPPDQADVFGELGADDQQTLLPQLETENAADILEELEDEDAAELAGRMRARTLAPILDEMTPDKAADLLGDLEPSLSAAALAQMQEPDEVRPLLLHADDTAGGLMTSEYLVFPQQMTASQVLTALRAWEPRGTETPYVFVIDSDGRLVGVANVFQIIRADVSETLSSLMDRAVMKAQVSDHQESAALLMSRYGLSAVPVVDDGNRLVGVITADDLVAVLEDEATEDIQRISGSQPLERPYQDTSVLFGVRKRLGWLLLLFVTHTLSGTVMRVYEDQIAQVLILATFVPLLIGTGGNVGSQSSAMIIRALAVGDVELRDSWRVLWREILTGLALGVVLSIVAYIRAVTWGASPTVGLVVGSAILAIVVGANCVGALLPLISAKLRLDPAAVSAPMLDTVVDATGLLIYFSIAAAVLRI